MIHRSLIATVLVWHIAAIAVTAADATSSSPATALQITLTALVTRDDPAQQRIDLAIQCTEPIEACTLRVYSDRGQLAEKTLGPLAQGANTLSVLLDEPKQAAETRWELSDGQTTLAETKITWTPPRHWTLHVLKSSHVDIGLYDSQYKQRFLTDECLDGAKRLAEETADWPDASRFRYAAEGLWWWLNYPPGSLRAGSHRTCEPLCQAGPVRNQRLPFRKPHAGFRNGGAVPQHL